MIMMIKKLFILFIVNVMFVGSCLSLAIANETNPFILPQYAKKVSLDFKNVDLKDVLKAFALQINANFIVAANVSDALITVSLDQVPVESAFDMLLSSQDLTYDYNEQTNIFLIRNKEQAQDPIMTKIFQLRYASVASAKINSTLSDSASSGSSSGSSSSSSSSSLMGGSSTGSSSSTTSTSAGITGVIESVLTKDGKVSEDMRTNSIIVSDVQSNFDNIEKVLARLDVPTVQVQIEVEMLDVSKTTMDELGSKFSGDFMTVGGPETAIQFPTSRGKFKDFIRDGSTMSMSGAKFTLEFLKEQTDTKSLARPKILTLDHETAEIMISLNEVIGATVETNTETGVVTETAERALTGVFLKVTPQVNVLTEEITMAVYPRVIEARQGMSAVYKDPEERGSKSILKVKNGDTVILGGLLRSEASTTITKVPFLGEIPVLGALFRHKSKEAKERELIIFMTPRIVNQVGGSVNAVNPAFNVLDRERSKTRDVEIEKALNHF